MSGPINRALYRLTRVPAPADHRPVVEAIASLLAGSAIEVLTTILGKADAKRAAPQRPARRKPVVRIVPNRGRE